MPYSKKGGVVPPVLSASRMQGCCMRRKLASALEWLTRQDNVTFSTKRIARPNIARTESIADANSTPGAVAKLHVICSLRQTVIATEFCSSVKPKEHRFLEMSKPARMITGRCCYTALFSSSRTRTRKSRNIGGPQGTYVACEK
jgi:hypothetical protein